MCLQSLHIPLLTATKLWTGWIYSQNTKARLFSTGALNKYCIERKRVLYIPQHFSTGERIASYQTYNRGKDMTVVCTQFGKISGIGCTVTDCATATERP